ATVHASAVSFNCGPHAHIRSCEPNQKGGTFCHCQCDRGYERIGGYQYAEGRGALSLPGCRAAGGTSTAAKNQPMRGYRAEAAPTRPVQRGRGGYQAEPARDNPPKSDAPNSSRKKPSDNQKSLDQPSPTTLGETAPASSAPTKPGAVSLAAKPVPTPD